MNHDTIPITTTTLTTITTATLPTTTNGFYLWWWPLSYYLPSSSLWELFSSVIAVAVMWRWVQHDLHFGLQSYVCVSKWLVVSLPLPSIFISLSLFHFFFFPFNNHLVDEMMWITTYEEHGMMWISIGFWC